MTRFIGEIKEDATVDFFFTTNNKSGAAVAPSTAFEAADLIIYKDNSATQKVTTNGITMTSPFDAITGLHQVSIDTSNDTGDAGFWVTGSDYAVILSPDETVDSESVVAVVAQFSIQNRLAGAIYSDTTIIHSDTLKIESDAAAVESELIVVHSETTHLQSDTAAIEAWGLGSVASDAAAIESELIVVHSETTHLQSDTAAIEGWGLGSVASDAAAIESELIVVHSETTHLQSDTAVIESDTTALELAVILASGTSDSGSTTTMVDAARTEADTDYWVGDRILFTSGNIAGQVREITAFTPGTDTITFSPATTQAVATQDYRIIQGVAASGLTAGQASDLAAIESELIIVHSETTHLQSDTAAIEGWGLGSVASDAAAIESELIVVHSETTHLQSDTAVIESDTTALELAVILASGTSDSGSTTTMVDAARTEADTDYWVGDRILFTSGNIAGQVREITAFTPGTDTITFSPATTQAVTTQDYRIIQGVAASGLTAGQASDLAAIESELIVTHSETTAIQTWGLGSVASDTAAIESELIVVHSETTHLQSDTAAIEIDTGNIYSDTTALEEAVILFSGTADSGSTTTLVDAALTEADTDYWAGVRVLFTSGNLAGQVREITAFTPGSDQITFSPATTQAVATHTYRIIQGVAASGLTAGQASDLAAIESELIIVHSETTVIASDTLVIESDTTAIEAALIMFSGTADSGSTTTLVDAALTEADTDYWVGVRLLFTSGNIAGQVREITAFTPGSDTVTFSPATTQAVATQDYVIVQGVAASGLTAGQASDLAAIESELIVVHSETTHLQSDTAAIEIDTGNIYSDTTHIHSDTIVIESDTLALEEAVILASGTSDSGSTTTMVDAARTEGDTDYWVGDRILFTSGTIAGQVREITAFTPGTDTITFSPATTQAVATQDYRIIQGVAASGLTAGQASDLAAIESELIVVHSDTAAIESELIEVHSETTAVQTDTGNIYSDTTHIHSDTIEISSDTAAIESELILVHSETTEIQTNFFVRQNTAQAGGVGTITLDASASATDDIYNGKLIHFTGGTAAGWTAIITDYNGTTKVATLWPQPATNPDGTTTFVIFTLGHVNAASFGLTGNAADNAGAFFTVSGYAASNSSIGTVDTVTNPVTLGASELSDLAAIESELIVVHSETTVIQTDTGNIYSDTTHLHSDTIVIEAWGLGSVASDAAAIESELIVVHSETTAIQTDTGNIYSDTTHIHSDTTAIPADVWTSATRQLTATGLDLILIDGRTFPNATEIIAAAVAGRVSGAGSGTETFLGLDEATTRIVVTVDGSGNRTDLVYS